MKIHPFVVMGVLFAALGIAALIHPSLNMPSKKKEIEIGGQRTIIETTRIIELPKAFAILLLVGGGAFFFLSTRKV